MNLHLRFSQQNLEDYQREIDQSTLPSCSQTCSVFIAGNNHRILENCATSLNVKNASLSTTVSLIETIITECHL